MARMRRPDVAAPNMELALEVAAREGHGAVIGGEVSQIGGRYLLTGEVVAPDGQMLAAFRETAAEDADLLPSIDRLSGAIRGKIGESLRSVRSGPPLAQVTTGSLEALRLYSEALRFEGSGDLLRALGLLEQAFRIDPEFAMAYRKTAVIWDIMDVNREAMVDASIRAGVGR